MHLSNSRRLHTSLLLILALLEFPAFSAQIPEDFTSSNLPFSLASLSRLKKQEEKGQNLAELMSSLFKTEELELLETLLQYQSMRQSNDPEAKSASYRKLMILYLLQGLYYEAAIACQQMLESSPSLENEHGAPETIAFFRDFEKRTKSIGKRIDLCFNQQELKKHLLSISDIKQLGSSVKGINSFAQYLAWTKSRQGRFLNNEISLRFPELPPKSQINPATQSAPHSFQKSIWEYSRLCDSLHGKTKESIERISETARRVSTPYIAAQAGLTIDPKLALEQCRLALQDSLKDSGNLETESVAEDRRDYAECLQRNKKIDEAIEQASLSIEAMKKLGCSPQKIADLERFMASLYFERENYIQATKCLQNALGFYQRVLSASDLRLAACRIELARVYKTENLHKKYAEMNVKKQAELFSSSNFIDESHAMNARNEMAAAYACNMLGQLENAELHYLQAAKEYRLAYGLTCPELSLVWRELSKLYSKFALYKQSEKMLLRVLERDSAVMSQHSTDAELLQLQTREVQDLALLADLYYKSAHYDESKQVCEIALNLLPLSSSKQLELKSILSLTLASILNLRDQNQKKAEEISRKILLSLDSEIKKRKLSKSSGSVQDLEYLKTRTTDFLRNIELDAGKINLSIESLEKSRTFSKNTFGEERLLDLTSEAKILEQQGDSEEAKAQYKKYYESCLTSFGAADPDTLKVLFLYCHSQGASGLKEVERLLSNNIQAVEKLKAIRMPEYSTMLSLQTQLYIATRRIPQARATLRKLLKHLESTVGVNNKAYADALEIAADLEKSDKNFQKAENYLAASLQLRKELYGVNSIFVADSKISYAKLALAENNLNKAEKAYKEAQGILAKSKTAKSLKMASCWEGLAGIYIRQNNFDQAEAALKKQESLYEELLGSQHPDLAEFYLKLGNLYLQIVKMNSAAKAYSKGLLIAQKDKKLLANELDYKIKLSGLQDNPEIAIAFAKDAISSWWTKGGTSRAGALVLNYYAGLKALDPKERLSASKLGLAILKSGAKQNAINSILKDFRAGRRFSSVSDKIDALGSALDYQGAKWPAELSGVRDQLISTMLSAMQELDRRKADETLAHWKEIIKKEDSTLARRLSLISLFSTYYLNQGNYEETKHCYQDALSLCKDQAAYYDSLLFRLARNMAISDQDPRRRLKELEEIKAKHAKSIQSPSNNVLWVIDMNKTLFDCGKLADARKLLRTATGTINFAEAEDMYLALVSLRCNLELLFGNYREIEHLLDSTFARLRSSKFANDFSRKEELVIIRSKCLIQEKKFKEAEEFLKLSLFEASRSSTCKFATRAQLLLELADAYKKQGKVKESENCLKNDLLGLLVAAKSKDRDLLISCYEKLAHICIEQGKMPESQHYLEECLKLEASNPDKLASPRRLLLLATCLKEQKKYEACYETSMKLNSRWAGNAPDPLGPGGMTYAEYLEFLSRLALEQDLHRREISEILKSSLPTSLDFSAKLRRAEIESEIVGFVLKHFGKSWSNLAKIQDSLGLKAESQYSMSVARKFAGEFKELQK